MQTLFATLEFSTVTQTAWELLSVLRLELSLIGFAAFAYIIFQVLSWRPPSKVVSDEAVQEDKQRSPRTQPTGGSVGGVTNGAWLPAVVAVAVGVIAFHQPPFTPHGSSLASAPLDGQRFGGVLDRRQPRLPTAAERAPAAACSEVLARPKEFQLGDRLMCQRSVILAVDKTPRALLGPSRSLFPDLEALVTECGSVKQQLEALQVLRSNVEELQQQAKNGEDATALLAEHAAQMFSSLKALEPLFSDAHDIFWHAVPRLQKVVRPDSNSPLSPVLDQLETVRMAARHCLLKAVREARVLSMVFKHFDTSSDDHIVTECVPGSMARIEALAVKEAKAEDEDHSDTPFDLGQYLSIVSVARGEAPCFSDGESEPALQRDAQGLLLPSDMLEAEIILQKAEEDTWEDFRPARTKARAVRVLEHANYLAGEKQLDSAAEQRYRLTATLSLQVNQTALASEALGRLGAMHLLRSRRKEALAAAEEALQFGEDPLAQYLQASLQLSLGVLPTGTDIKKAAQQLQSLAGRLPWESLEKERSALESDLATWDAVAEGDTMKCFGLADVAKILICLVGRFAF
eukprot:TRINITY_DN80809_c0_g1_i1.p1 TRINITY_DN80809_c0_g1~~TRINITY_DN80809_c0_g1_i1.p1  ORF type:complete len:574 (+),score=141.78 TRINITY_DN80809_c0_g1_i1:177-1898(+)